jgi:hypothetical protein
MVRTEDFAARTIVRKETVTFAQSGVSKRVEISEVDDVAIVGTLMLATEDPRNITPHSTYLVWVPYSFLSTFAPELLSATAEQAIASATGALSPEEQSRKDEQWSFEQSQTICVPLAFIEKVHRRTNMRGRRTLVIHRTGRTAPESALGFGEGGSTQFFEALRTFVELKPLIGEGREAWSIALPPMPSPTRAQLNLNAAASPAKANIGAPPASEPQSARKAELGPSPDSSVDLPVTDHPGVAVGGLTSGAGSPAASPSAAGSRHKDPGHPPSRSPAAAPAASSGMGTNDSVDAFKHDLYGQKKKGLIAGLLRGGSKIAEAVTKQLDTLIAESPTEQSPLDVRGESDYDVIERVQPVENLVPQVVPPPNAPRFGQPLRPSNWNSCFECTQSNTAP